MHQFLAIEHNDAQIPPSQLQGNRAANDAATHDDDVICIHKIILAVKAGSRRRPEAKQDIPVWDLVAQVSALEILNYVCTRQGQSQNHTAFCAVFDSVL
jgi:hypothetical protein